MGSNKDEERFFLEMFISESGIPAVINLDREEPDFEVALSDRVIGIEITKILIPPFSGQMGLKAAESVAEKVVSKAKRIFEGTSDNCVHVTVLFFSGVDLRYKRRDQLSQALAELVKGLTEQYNRHTAWENDYLDDRLDAIARVSVFPVPHRQLGKWTIAGAGWVAPLEIDILQSRVNEKNIKIEKYRRSYCEVWLVMVIQGNKPSSFFSIDSQTAISEIQSDFDQTYLFSMFPPARVIQLGNSGK